MTAAGRDVSAAAGIHLAVAAVVWAAALAVLPAADRASAVAQAQAIALCGLGYVASWLISRQRELRSPLLVAAVAIGAVCGGYFLLQYRHLAAPEVKVAVLDSLGRNLSGAIPPLGSWAPFPNSLATLLEGLVLVGLGLSLARGPVVTRVLAGSATALLVLACAVSASRGSWLAIAAALAAFATVRYWLPLRVAVAAAVVATLAAVVAGTVSGGVPWWIRWASVAGRPDRLDVYQQAASLLRDVPYTGVGGGDQFAAAAAKYVLLIQVPFLTYAHNLGLQLWLDLGLAGLAAWWALAAATAVAAVAGERGGLGRRFRGVWAGLLAIHVHGLTDARQFVDPWTWVPFFVLTGVLAGYVSRSTCRVPKWVAWSPAAVAAVVVVAATAGRGDPLAAWHANRGALAQARADTATAGDGADGAAERAVALRRFDRALEFDADDGPALRRSGMLALDDARYSDAVERLARAWAVEPGHPPTRKAYGLALVWSGDTREAAALLEAVPGMADELVTWSRWRHQRGEAALAVAAARTSLAMAPHQPEVAAWLRQLEGAPPAGETPPR